MDDLALVDVDFAASAAVVQREDAGLGGNSHELKDVGQRQLGQ